MEYTVEIYKKDARKKSGERLVQTFDIAVESPRAAVELHYSVIAPAADGFRVELHETFVTRKNLLTGVEFKERYDTPYFCSPSSETYWST